MPDQTRSALTHNEFIGIPLEVLGPDADILRELARNVADLAARPEEAELKKLWYDHNALLDTRPLVFCDPENGWNEIITEKDLSCEGVLARQWEFMLRKEIFWGAEMGDDRVTMDYFPVPYVYSKTDWGMQVTLEGGEDGGSYRWDAPLKSYDHISKLHFPEILVDYNDTEQLMAVAQDVFKDILPVRLQGAWWWSLGMTADLVKIRGLEQVNFDIYDNPGGLHSLMAFLRNCTLYTLDYLERENLLSLNNDGTYVGSGGFGWTSELPQLDYDGKHVRTADMWGFAESQETTSWSPEAFREFVFPYQLPVLERFGLNCYGCCEPLDDRWDLVETIPRLRRVSVSPWSNVDVMSEKLADYFIYSWKPNPSALATPKINEDAIRAELKLTMEKTKGNVVEVIMKDNHTIGKNPENVKRWCALAREAAENT